MSNIPDMEGPMAFREKQAWISMLTTLVVYAVYFFFFGRALRHGEQFGMGGPVTLAIVAIVVLQIVLNIGAAILWPHDQRGPMDERETEIHRRATAGSFYALTAGAVIAAGSVYFVDKWFMANLIVGALAVAQVGQYGAVIGGYRRGF